MVIFKNIFLHIIDYIQRKIKKNKTIVIVGIDG